MDKTKINRRNLKDFNSNIKKGLSLFHKPFSVLTLCKHKVGFRRANPFPSECTDSYYTTFHRQVTAITRSQGLCFHNLPTYHS